MLNLTLLNKIINNMSMVHTHVRTHTHTHTHTQRMNAILTLKTLKKHDQMRCTNHIHFSGSNTPLVIMYLRTM